MLRRLFFVLAATLAVVAEDSASLVLRSEPAGALIFLNGTSLQLRTPAVVRVPAGSYKVAFWKRDYIVSVSCGDVVSDQTAEIDARLRSDLDVPFSAQLSGVPDFVRGRREALEFFRSVLDLSRSYYVHEVPSDLLVKAAVRALVEGIDGVRAREELLKASLTAEDIESFYGAQPSIAEYGPLELTVRSFDDGSESWQLRAPNMDATLACDFQKGEPLTDLLADFGAVFAFLTETYDSKHRISDDSLIDLAVRGVFSHLEDDYARMIYPTALVEMRSKHSGEFGGLGITITIREGALVVIAPIEGTPAYKAGIQRGDIITHIEGEPTSGIGLQESVDKMRGEPGTAVRITIARPGSFDAKELEIVRDVIPLRFERSALIDGYGYIRLTTFNSKRISADLRHDIEGLLAQGARGIILDLRDNPGGLLTQAHEVVDLFIKKGVTVSVVGRVREETLEAQAEGTFDTIPLAVLINEGSASASEIVAGAIQDHRRGVVVGERSFGKGTVQMVLNIDPFDSAMAITIAKYLLPSGRTIEKHGVDPDVVVPLDPEAQPARVSLYEENWAPDDNQIRAAIEALEARKIRE